MVAKYSMEIQALRTQLKYEKSQKDAANTSQARFQELEKKYKELTQGKEPNKFLLLSLNDDRIIIC